MKKLLGLTLTLIFTLTLIPAASFANEDHECIKSSWQDGGCESRLGVPGNHYWWKYCRICERILEERTTICPGNGMHLLPFPKNP